ncbi:hypothetical protein [Actinophytocola sp.]|uniref:hypothetical protein n=1 Tax=Actinophytocola sp. TaxID=1872138 RepID=UPI003D6BCC36
MGTTRRLLVPGVCLAMAVAVLAPLFGRGFTLTYDMVFAPRQDLLPDTLGLSSALPRAVPADAVVALLTSVLPGDLLQQLLLAAALFAGPLGAARYLREHGLGVRVVAAVVYGWSGFVAERLFIGHWPYLLTYACLPWIAQAAGRAHVAGRVHAAGRTRDAARDPRTPRHAAALVLVMVPAVLTPSGGIIAAGTAMVCGGARRLWLTATIALVLNAPWWVPAILNPSGGLSPATGVDAFEPRAESWGGAITSLLGLGGIWNAEVVPASRAHPIVPLLILAMAGVAILGMRKLPRPLVILGVAGLALATLGGSALLGWVVENVPGGGLLRDSQKWVAWWALPFALGFALGVRQAAETLKRGRKALLAGAAIVPIAIMPDLAWAGWGRLERVDYPRDWTEVRHILETSPQDGDVLTLPFGAFRRFDWNGDRTLHDPAPQYLPRATVVDDTLVVGGRPVAGEDPRVVAVREELTAGGDLTGLGIGWILVEHGTPGIVEETVLNPDERIYQGRWLDLYQLRGPLKSDTTGRPPTAPVIAADVLALATVTLSMLWLVLPAGSLRRSSRRTQE